MMAAMLDARRPVTGRRMVTPTVNDFEKSRLLMRRSPLEDDMFSIGVPASKASQGEQIESYCVGREQGLPSHKPACISHSVDFRLL